MEAREDPAASSEILTVDHQPFRRHVDGIVLAPALIEMRVLGQCKGRMDLKFLQIGRVKNHQMVGSVKGAVLVGLPIFWWAPPGVVLAVVLMG